MQVLKQMLGLVQAALLWYSKPAKKTKVLRLLFTMVYDRYPSKGNEFVLLVGFSGSGKTTHRLRSARYYRYASVPTTSIHEALNDSYSLLNDDRTVTGQGYWARQWLTKWTRARLLNIFCYRNYCIVEDACNLIAAERAERLAIAKKYGYTTIIVHTMCDEKILIARLQKLDRQKVERGEIPTWVNLYNNIQLPRFQPPSPQEADTLITVDTTQYNPR